MVRGKSELRTQLGVDLVEPRLQGSVNPRPVIKGVGMKIRYHGMRRPGTTGEEECAHRQCRERRCSPPLFHCLAAVTLRKKSRHRQQNRSASKLLPYISQLHVANAG